MENLKIASDLSLPRNAVTQKLAILGGSGSGKSYTAQKLAELMLAIGAQIICVDPVGIWYSLRLSKSGKKQVNKHVIIFGGDYGDLPLLPGQGALLGKVLAERRISAVLDVSSLTIGETKKFLTAFAESFFQTKKKNRSPVHLFLDECQTYLPQDKEDADDPLMLGRWTRLIKIIRNYGGGTSMISQQPQAVNKKALNLAETLFAMRTTGTHERKAIKNWVGDVVQAEEELVGHLPKLETGTAHIWSPHWLKTSRDIHILEKKTFDAGKTPEMDDAEIEPVKLSRADVGKLQSSLSEMIEQAKLDDPDELKSKIRDLTAQVTTLRAKNDKFNKPASEPALQPRERIAMQKSITALRSALEGALKLMEKMKAQRFESVVDQKALAGIIQNCAQQVAKLYDEAGKLTRKELAALQVDAGKFHDRLAALLKSSEIAAPMLPTHPTHPTAPPPAAGAPVRSVEAPTVPAEGLTGPQQRILNSLAWWESIGISSPTIVAVGFRARYSPKGGSFRNPKGELVKMGLVKQIGKTLLELTDDGRSKAVYPDSNPTAEDLQNAVMSVLPGPERAIISALLKNRTGMSNEDLAAASGYEPTGGSYRNPRGKLSKFGLLIYDRANDLITPAPLLFLEK